MTKGFAELFSGPHVAVTEEKLGSDQFSRFRKGLLGSHGQKASVFASFLSLFDVCLHFEHFFVLVEFFEAVAAHWVVQGVVFLLTALFTALFALLRLVKSVIFRHIVGIKEEVFSSALSEARFRFQILLCLFDKQIESKRVSSVD